MVPLLRVGDLDGATLAALAEIDRAATPENAQRLQTARQIDALIGLLVAPLAFLLLFGWAAFSWLRFGRDPEYIDDPSIYAAGPPEELTPALASMILEGYPRRRALTSAVLDLASRGEFVFKEEPDGDHGKVGIQLGGQIDDRMRVINRQRPIGKPERTILEEIRVLGLADDDRYIRPVELRSLGEVVGTFNDRVEASVVDKGWFTDRPRRVRNRWLKRGICEILLGIVAFAAAAFLPSGGLTLVGVAIVAAGVGTLILAPCDAGAHPRRRDDPRDARRVPPDAREDDRAVPLARCRGRRRAPALARGARPAARLGHGAGAPGRARCAARARGRGRQLGRGAGRLDLSPGLVRHLGRRRLRLGWLDFRLERRSHLAGLRPHVRHRHPQLRRDVRGPGHDRRHRRRQLVERGIELQQQLEQQLRRRQLGRRRRWRRRRLLSRGSRTSGTAAWTPDRTAPEPAREAPIQSRRVTRPVALSCRCRHVSAFEPTAPRGSPRAFELPRRFLAAVLVVLALVTAGCDVFTTTTSPLASPAGPTQRGTAAAQSSGSPSASSAASPGASATAVASGARRAPRRRPAADADPSPTATPSPTPAPTPTPEPTPATCTSRAPSDLSAEWQDLKSHDGDYTFKYPEDWEHLYGAFLFKTSTLLDPVTLADTGLPEDHTTKADLVRAPESGIPNASVLIVPGVLATAEEIYTRQELRFREIEDSTIMRTDIEMCLDGLTAYGVEFVFGEEETLQRSMYVVHNGRSYDFQWLATKADPDVRMFDEMARTWKWTPDFPVATPLPTPSSTRGAECQPRRVGQRVRDGGDGVEHRPRRRPRPTPRPSRRPCPRTCARSTRCSCSRRA